MIAPSARRHGISDEDMLHAYDNPIRVFEVDEGFTMLVGGSRAGALLEIGVVRGADGVVVVHAMGARDRFR